MTSLRHGEEFVQTVCDCGHRISDHRSSIMIEFSYVTYVVMFNDFHEHQLIRGYGGGLDMDDESRHLQGPNIFLQGLATGKSHSSVGLIRFRHNPHKRPVNS